MTAYSQLENETCLLKPQPTIVEVTNFFERKCKLPLVKTALLFTGFTSLIVLLGHTMGMCPHLNGSIVVIRVSNVIHNTSEEFLSVALDTSMIKERWASFNISSTKFIQRAKIFSPGYLRIGGTTADKLIFKADSKEGNEGEMGSTYSPMDGGQEAYENLLLGKTIDTFTMTGADWIMINNFVKDAGLKLLFDLNVLLRQEEKWNNSNAVELIKFSDEHGFDVAWQLGNEPNSFPHVFHTKISGNQLGEDFNSLKKVLQSFPRYTNSILVGPDVTRPKFMADPSIEYLTEFLKSGGKAINATTWHQYYLNGHEARFEDFLNPQTFNLLYKQILAVKLAVSDIFNGTDKMPIWLSETGSAYGGGAPGLSNRFIAGFLWLDKLGLSAQMGIDVVIRQSLYNGYYALLEKKTFDPLPDWWISVLYKMFVGPGVLQTSLLTGFVRLYCQCTPPGSSLSANGTVTMFGMNMLEEPVEIIPKGLPTPMRTSKIHAYILTGGSGSRLSKNVLLNGQILKLHDDGSLPRFLPLQVDHYNIHMPPSSIGFFVLNGITVPACKPTA